MPNELKRKLRDITAEELGQQPKLKKVRLQCALLLRGVQFNTTHNLDSLMPLLSLSLKCFYYLNQNQNPKNKGIQNSEFKRLTTLLN